MTQKKWEVFGRGSYNAVYRSKDGHSILKVQLDLFDNNNNPEPTDLPERSVRLWNELNPDLPKAKVVEVELDERPIFIHNVLGRTNDVRAERFPRKRFKGWCCPFIEGVQPSDNEISIALVDIFNRTGRIVVDAPSKNNFIRTPNGQIVCTDIGCALELEKREQVVFEGRLKRRKSQVSLDNWRYNEKNYQKYFTLYSDVSKPYACPKTVATIKALLFIKMNRPDIYDVSFLKESPELISQLAKAYDEHYKLRLAGRPESENGVVNASAASLDIAHDAHVLQQQQERAQAIVERFQGEINAIVVSFDQCSSTLEVTSQKEQLVSKLKCITDNLEYERAHIILNSTSFYDSIVQQKYLEISTKAAAAQERVHEEEIRIAKTQEEVRCQQEEVDAALQILEQQREITLYHIKESCILELKQYIESRGDLDDKNNFIPSFITRFFRNKELTTNKVGIAQSLIAQIEHAESTDEMKEAIYAVMDIPGALKSIFTSGLAASLGKNLLLLDVAEQHIEYRAALGDLSL